MTTQAIFETITPSRLAEVLQLAGYRVSESEQNGVVQLLSASQGIGFAVRFGNPAQEPAGAYLDYTLSCALRVQGDVPADLVGRWNESKRFARLSLQGPFLVLEMDVVIAGGVTERQLRVHVEIWDRLLQEFLLFLRNFAAQAAQDATGTQAGELGQAAGSAASAAADETAAVSPVVSPATVDVE